MDKSAVGVTGVDAELVLLFGFGSKVPLGNVMVAVLVIVPVAPAETRPLMVIVTEEPEGNVLTIPDTLLPTTEMDAGHTAPLVADPQVADTVLIAAGTWSLNDVPPAALGPALLISTV